MGCCGSKAEMAEEAYNSADHISEVESVSEASTHSTELAHRKPLMGTATLGGGGNGVADRTVKKSTKKQGTESSEDEASNPDKYFQKGEELPDGWSRRPREWTHG